MKIALCGIAGSGKDFLAQSLIDEGYTRFAFADILKNFCSELYPFLKKDYPAFEKEQPLNIDYKGVFIDKTPREIWIETSAFIRKFNPTFFHDLSLKTLSNFNDNIIVPDLRMAIEFEDLQKLGFTIIYIKPNILHYEPNNFDKQIDEFKDKIDYTFENNFDGLEPFKEFLKNIEG